MLGLDSCQVHHNNLMPITSNGKSINTSTNPTTNGSTIGLSFSLETHTISVYRSEGSVKEADTNSMRINYTNRWQTVTNTETVL